MRRIRLAFNTLLLRLAPLTDWMSDGASAYSGNSKSLISYPAQLAILRLTPLFSSCTPTKKEMIMAKGQARSNREKKKPKADKVPGAGTPALTKGMQPPIKIPTGKS